MGVLRLLDVPTLKNKIVRELFVEVPDLSQFKEVCVDASYVAYTIVCGLYKERDQFDANRDRFKSGFAYFMSNLFSQNVSMIFVFDGFNKKKEFIREKRSAAVKSTLNKRVGSIMSTVYNIKSDYKLSSEGSKLTVEHESDVIELNFPYPTKQDYAFMREFLTVLGVPFVVAKDIEAEQLAVLLCKRFNYSAVLSADTDVLMCGGTLLTATRTGYRHLSCATVLESMGVDYRKFVEMCLHLGCDFCEKTPSIGPKTVLKKDVALSESQSRIYEYIVNLEYGFPLHFSFVHNDDSTITQYLSTLNILSFHLPCFGEDSAVLQFPYSEKFFRNI